MSTIQSTAGSTGTSQSPGLVLGLKITSVLLALGLLVQAWLGSSGFFEGESNLTSTHEMLGNVFFLVAVAQIALSFFALQKGVAARPLLIVSILLLADVIAQLGLGYVGRENASAMAWHVPNGVLLMGLCTLSLVLAWNRPGAERETATATGQ